jgi:hypothetical protein
MLSDDVNVIVVTPVAGGSVVPGVIPQEVSDKEAGTMKSRNRNSHFFLFIIGILRWYEPFGYVHESAPLLDTFPFSMSSL